MAVQVGIVGAGPAGAAAAIQLARMGLQPLVFEKETIGGLLQHALLVENYLGFPAGISGEKLASLIRRHLSRLHVAVIHEEVVRVDREGGVFAVRTESGCYGVGTLVVASGTKPRKPGFPVDPRSAGRVFFGPPPGERMRGRSALVIGAGDAAFDYALNLSRYGDVAILCRGAGARALPLLQARVEKSAAIEVFFGVTIEAVKAAGRGVVVQAVCSGRRVRFVGDTVVCALGREKNLDFFGPGLKREWPELGKSGSLRLAGDVKGGPCRQVGIAAGDGLRAAMEIGLRPGRGGNDR